MKVLICGAFGYGNLGDNLLRDTLIKLLSKKFGNSVEIYVDQPHPNEELIDYVDLRIIGPGGLLYDNNETHKDYLLKYAKDPFILFGIGAQYPDEIDEKDGLIKKLMEKAKIVVLRSNEDFITLNKFRPKLDNIFIAPDIAFFSKVNEFKVKSFKDKENRVILCPNTSLLNIKQKLELCSYAEKGLFDNIISFSIEDDKFVEELARYIDPNRTTIEKYFDYPEYMFSLIDNSDLLITSRYHAGVFGLLSTRTKVVSLPTKSERPSYKLKTLLKDKINWKLLEDNREEYINSIQKPNNINNILLSDILNSNFGPIDILENYFKEFNK